MGRFRSFPGNGIPLEVMEVPTDRSTEMESDEDKARAIKNCLAYLQWEAHTAGLDFLADMIGVAKLAAADLEGKTN